jgi:hypothetical protein
VTYGVFACGGAAVCAVLVTGGIVDCACWSGEPGEVSSSYSSNWP